MQSESEVSVLLKKSAREWHHARGRGRCPQFPREARVNCWALCVHARRIARRDSAVAYLARRPFGLAQPNFDNEVARA
eukprot:scaffold221562_cov28-Tisochrysis_lutea.AAC.1